MSNEKSFPGWVSPQISLLRSISEQIQNETEAQHDDAYLLAGQLIVSQNLYRLARAVEKGT